MTTTIARSQERPASAVAKLRLIETATFRLLPVPNDAIDGSNWNHRVADWAAA